MRVLSRDDLDGLLSPGQAVEVLEAALRRYSPHTVVMPDARRLSLRIPPAPPATAETFCFAKLCHLAFAGIVGFRVVAAGADPDRSTRFIVLAEADGGEPLALVDEHGLYRVRVGALAGVAVRHLARRRPGVTVGLVGTGPLARAILSAILVVVRPARVMVASRRSESRQAFVAEVGASAGVEVLAAESVRDAVVTADVVVTATTATTPILQPEWIRPGALVYLVGAGCEADSEVYRRASRIVVSDWRECLTRPDVAGMVQRGELSEADVAAHLHEVVQGTRPGRTSDDDMIVVRAPGTVFHDVILAHHVYLQALQAQRGWEVGR